MNNKEKVWTAELASQHPHKWILTTNLEWVPQQRGSKDMGYVYGIYDTYDEARAIELSLNDTFGETHIIKGETYEIKIGGIVFDE